VFVIHEGRFYLCKITGFVLVEDLGGWWEKETGCPIPLGAIVAKKTLEEDMIASIEAAIRKSLKNGAVCP